MAEAILKNKNIEGIEVRSAGIYAVSGCSASGLAKVVLDENNVPHDHQSNSLTKANVDWATIILTMTASHKETITQNFPGFSDKIYTLKEFGGEGENWDVMDPFGGDLGTYRTTYEELKKFIELAILRFKSNF